jgi:hypothetical protein
MSKINGINNIDQINSEMQDATVEESNLDVNMIISVFQEKLSQLMTEIVIKDATIRQQANLINKLKGNK